MKLGYYLRLSMADGDLGADNKDESNSIENQRELIQSYVDASEEFRGCTATDYIDDGFTGTNFNRPSFKRLIEDCKKGEIQVVLLKDLSRLGRDYIEVGDYLEQIFPVLGIRVIAINSSYDSNDHVGNTMGLDMSITNLVNTLYSRDLSKKFKSSVRTKWKQGISTSGRVPFGYRKDKERNWYIDEEAAQYVRLIFDKACDGWTTRMIAEHLNDIGAPTPGRYREITKDWDAWPRKVTQEEWLWDIEKVWRILKNYSYTGALVHGKTEPLSVGNPKRRKVKKSDVFVKDDVHVAIVSKEQFEEAQLAVRSSNRDRPRLDAGFSLKGKIRCGNCNLIMNYHQGKATPIVTCGHAIQSGKHSTCDRTRHVASHVERVVHVALMDKLRLLGYLEDILKKENDEHLPNYLQMKSEIKKKMEVLKKERIRQYEAYAEGIIQQELYLAKKKQIAEQIKALEEQEQQIGATVEQELLLLKDAEKVRTMAADLKVFQSMSKKLAEVFIDEVIIYSKEKMEVRFTFEDLMQKMMVYGKEQKVC